MACNQIIRLLRLALVAVIMSVAAPSQADDVAARNGLAAALGLSPDALTDVYAVSVPSGGPLRAIWLARHPSTDPTDAKPTATVALVPGCTGCPPELLAIRNVDALQLLAVVDLGGTGGALPLAKDAAAVSAPRLRAGLTHPAVLLLARRDWGGGDWQDEAILCGLIRPPRLLWREPIREHRPDGGGFETFAAELEPAGPWSTIVLHQTTLPGAGDQPFMPGPPLTLRYVYDGDVYRKD
jgi:hypothetical protein